MAHVLVREVTDAELLAEAGSEYDDQGQLINPLFIAGRLTPGAKLGGMVFDATDGTEGGQQIRFYTLAEIKVAPFRNYTFVHTREGYASLPDSGAGKFVMPFQVARTYGVV